MQVNPKFKRADYSTQYFIEFKRKRFDLPTDVYEFSQMNNLYWAWHSSAPTFHIIKVIMFNLKFICACYIWHFFIYFFSPIKHKILKMFILPLEFKFHIKSDRWSFGTKCQKSWLFFIFNIYLDLFSFYQHP